MLCNVNKHIIRKRKAFTENSGLCLIAKIGLEYLQVLLILCTWKLFMAPKPQDDIYPEHAVD